MSKARDSIEDLKTIDANLAAKAPLASPSFTGTTTANKLNVTGVVDNTISGTLVVKGSLSANQTSGLALFQQSSTASTIKAFGPDATTTGILNTYVAASDGSPDLLITSVTANGLTFNGDTAAANALDDYEEGTWTPSITRDSNPSIGSYQVRYGKYTKIGNQVTLFCEVASSTVSGGSGIWKCTGLPFSSAGINANTTVGRNYMSGDTNDRDFRIHSNVARLIKTSVDSYFQANVTYVIWTFTATFQVS